MIKVQVVYALKEHQEVIEVELPNDSTIIDAIKKSNFLQKYKLDEDSLIVGIYSKKMPITSKLEENDRVEIYRPLQVSTEQKKSKKITIEK